MSDKVRVLHRRTAVVENDCDNVELFVPADPQDQTIFLAVADTETGKTATAALTVDTAAELGQEITNCASMKRGQLA